MPSLAVLSEPYILLIESKMLKDWVDVLKASKSLEVLDWIENCSTESLKMFVVLSAKVSILKYVIVVRVADNSLPVESVTEIPS